ncbi:DUF445 domain-containing protein [Pseudoalteromonas sp.]|uniref:DUF445 domain-containing protein n=1 Tax=unclassified Pseudoalteromonas TaxID=194690 RepID=UPI003F944E6E
MNKSVVTNFIAAVCVAVGYFFEQSILLSVGLFALSGAVTNLLAIHMLFDKVPFLYGSGVITLKFERFKEAIKHLILTEFFSPEKINQFLSSQTEQIDLAPVIGKVDLNPAFDNLVDVIEQSQFGSMLAMMGGAAALEPMRESFIEKMQHSMTEISQSEQFKQLLSAHLTPSATDDNALYNTITTLVDERLNELTPVMVKNIIQTMIREHLGWLVVWGGVFGGVFGLIAAII